MSLVHPASHPLARYGTVLLCLAALGLLAAKTVRVEADFAAFLPPSATPEERLLIAQLRDGLVSRLMLIALHGGDEAALARASRGVAEKLGRAPEFDYAANGSLEQFAAQGEVLLRHRYALSPAIDAQRFAAPALRAALEEQQAQLGSPFGVVSRAVLARDPTGEMFALLRQFDPGGRPALRHGVWFSADGQRAFLVAQTRAPGFDSVRQSAAMAAVRQALTETDPKVGLTLTGPGVFAAESRRVIERDSVRLSLCSGLAVLAMLAFVYRSPLAIALVMVPVASGLLVGVLVVQGLFGTVHGITLGFAATLVGEAVDYPSYLLLNTAQGETARGAARRIGGTLALAVLSTVASALALALSDFTGLAQLGVLTMVGVCIAGLVTHRVLPWLLGERVLRFHRPLVPALPAISRATWPRLLAAIATLGALAWLAADYPAWRERDLANLSPVPAPMRELDGQLRRELGAPEVSFFLASGGASEVAALEAAERILPVLDQWKQAGWIRSYDSPAWYLPSPATQAGRRNALPDGAALQANLDEALRGLAFRPDAFAPFVREVQAARGQPPLTRAAYAGTPLGAKLDAMVVQLDGQWLALTPLAGVDAARLAAQWDVTQAVMQGMPAGTRLVDLKQISARMVEGFSSAALAQTALGAMLIFLLLVFGLRSFGRALRVMAPAASALALTAAILTLLGQRIGVFHLVALLLVLGIGLNYALFFERPPSDADDRARTRLALAVCSVSTVITFGLLSLSSTPVLHAIGATVALGAVASLALGAAWARPKEAA